MRGMESRWTDRQIQIGDFTAILRQLDGDARIMQLVLRLQSTAGCDASGLCSRWKDLSEHTKLVDLLAAVLVQFEPTRVLTLDPNGWFRAGFPDASVGSHVEHQTAALFAREALDGWTPAVKPQVSYFRDYNNAFMPPTAGSGERWAKARANQALVLTDTGQEKWNNNSGWGQVSLQGETAFQPRDDQASRRLLAVGSQSAGGCLRALPDGIHVALGPCAGDSQNSNLRASSAGSADPRPRPRRKHHRARLHTARILSRGTISSWITWTALIEPSWSVVPLPLLDAKLRAQYRWRRASGRRHGGVLRLPITLRGPAREARRRATGAVRARLVPARLGARRGGGGPHRVGASRAGR